MAGAKFEFDEREAMEELLLQYGHIAEAGASILAEELRSMIPLSDEPSEPHGPPHSSGPLRDSIRSGRARRRGDEMVAYTISDLMAGDDGIPLLVLLDEGSETMEPRPIIDQAEINAQRRIDALAAQESRS